MSPTEAKAHVLEAWGGEADISGRWSKKLTNTMAGIQEQINSGINLHTTHPFSVYYELPSVLPWHAPIIELRVQA